MNVKTLGSFPPDSNPFSHDLYHMGVEIGKNVIVMYANHPGEQCDYLIVVNRETGERMQVNFSAAGAKMAEKNEAYDFYQSSVLIRRLSCCILS